MKKPPFIAKALMLLFCLILLNTSKATNYYFSQTGNDNRTFQEAQNPATPWRSLGKLNAVFSSLEPGDTIFFKRGDVFEGSLNITRSGSSNSPIVLAAYGSGPKPVISGFTVVTGWLPISANIWEAPVNSAAQVNVVLLNNMPQAIGRYPNASVANGGYLKYESYSGSQSITDQQLSSAPNWTGGEVVIRKNRWVLDRNKITQHNGNTIFYTSGSGYDGSDNYGYFIQNHPQALDQAGEWYHKTAEGKLGIFLASGQPSSYSIKAATVDKLVMLDNQSHIVLKDLSFEGSNEATIDVRNAQYITVDNCSILHAGTNAVNVVNTSHFTLQQTIVENTGNIAFDIQNSFYTLIKNNRIKNTGTRPGMGLGNSGSYEAIMLNGDNNTVEGNNIDSTGYIPLTFSGNSITIRNNYIRHFAFVKDDGGGIYTWNNGANAPVHNNRKIIGNIVLDGIGAGEGTDNPSARFAHGIYMDDNTDHVEIRGNTVSGCAQFGFFIHNAHDIILKNNTSFNNSKQLVMEHDNIAPGSPVNNVISTGNIWFAKDNSQMIADYKTINNDLAGFGLFDSNYYCRPIDDQFMVYSAYRDNGTYHGSMHDLEGWKAAFGKDMASQQSPVLIPTYHISSYAGSNQFANGSFTSNINGLYAYSPANNCNVTWSQSSPLDGGALKLAFTPLTGNTNAASVILEAGSVTAGRAYILKFSMAGGEANKNIEVFLRQSGSPYADLSPRKLCRVSGARSENEYLFTPTISQASASIVFDVREQSSALYFDNIRLREANITSINPEDSIRFEFNNTPSPQTVALNGIYVDARNNLYNNSITLLPFTSAVLIKRSSPMIVLPTRFTSFTAVKAGQAVKLNWIVYTTDDPASYTVERSADGQRFDAIGELVALPDTTTYAFTDDSPLAGKNYYRIRQNTASGNRYSAVEVVLPAGAGGGMPEGYWSINPNPVQDGLHISFRKMLSGNFSVYTISGIMVKTFPFSGTDARIDLSALSKGAYFLRFTNGKNTSVKRFIKD
ncbi:MAG TPA: right-handed parallel beta-helix repeat-containing protein [Flavisolibacter sp.]